MTTSPRIACIAVTPQGLDQARRLRQRLQTGVLYRPARYGVAQHAWEYPFEATLSTQVATLFTQYDHLVFFLATEVVTRLLASCLTSKTTDPGVLAVDETCRFVIQVLPGPTGDAKTLARTVAGYLGAVPVITTASDAMGDLSPDILEDVCGWRAEPPERRQASAMDLVNREAEAIVQEVAGRVVFIGAGPGDPELLTVKGQRLLSQADVVIYAGSLIPDALLQHAPATATLHNSAPLTLEQVMDLIRAAVHAGKVVVRLQSGDLSLYSTMQEHIALLDQEGIAYEAIPGISAFQAAAAALQRELTVPEVVQTIILTRGEGTMKMPAGESLTALAAHRASLCLFLSARLSKKVQEQLLTAYAPDTPVAILYRVSWPDEKIIVTRLQKLHSTIRQHHLTRTMLILVGEALGGGQHRSRLYHATHGHIFRKRSLPGRDADPSAPEHGAGSPRHAPTSDPAEATS